MVSPFEELGLQPQFIQVVTQMGYEQPTAIQQAAIPVLLEGHDLMGQAQTGTGKTAAFVLPMLQNLQPGKNYVQALILAPTRELAIQVTEAASKLAATTKARVLTVYGGQPYSVQIRQLERGVDVVVGTPGRLLDLLRKEALDLSHVRYLVLDEADEMLEMGFVEDVESILSQIPAERQMSLFSATLPEAVRKLANNYLKNPQKISINASRPSVEAIEQRYVRVRDENKVAALLRMLEAEDIKSALIFTRTKARAQEVADELVRRGYSAESLHGDLTQSTREFVTNRFRTGANTLLVATDVAARGLDFEDISHVFNFDLPDDPPDYLHRIGRTGRAGRKGIAISFMTQREFSRLRQIEGYVRAKLVEVTVPTPDEIKTRRDDQFIKRLYEQMLQASSARELTMLARLVEAGLDPLDIAAAAMQMARAGENEKVLEQFSEPAPKASYRTTPGRRSEEDSRGARRPARPGERVRTREDAPRFDRGNRASRESESGMVRLRMDLGDAQGLRPGDVVGAIAGEVGIPGKAIGQIDIHRDHTFVDISEKHVRRVLSASEGQYMLHGKPVLLKLAH